MIFGLNDNLSYAFCKPSTSDILPFLNLPDSDKLAGQNVLRFGGEETNWKMNNGFIILM